MQCSTAEGNWLSVQVIVWFEEMMVQEIRFPLYLHMHSWNLRVVIWFLFSPVVDAGHVYLSSLCCFLGFVVTGYGCHYAVRMNWKWLYILTYLNNLCAWHLSRLLVQTFPWRCKGLRNKLFCSALLGSKGEKEKEGNGMGRWVPGNQRDDNLQQSYPL